MATGPRGPPQPPATGGAGPQRRAEGTRRRFRPARTELCPGRTPRHAAAPSPPPSGPTRLPSSCCSPPPSLLSNVSRGPERPRRREGTRASSEKARRPTGRADLQLQRPLAVRRGLTPAVSVQRRAPGGRRRTRPRPPRVLLAAPNPQDPW